MSKYYDLDKLKELIEAKAETLIGDGAIAFYYVAKWLDFFHPADVTPVVHAHWERLDKPKSKCDWYRCTNCGRDQVRSYDDPHSIYETLPYCNCGAKMEEEVKEDA